MTTTASFTGGPGTFTILDDTPLAIYTFQTAWATNWALDYEYKLSNWSPIGSGVTNTPIAQMVAISITLGNISTYLKNIDSKTGTINASIQQLTESVQTLTTGAAAIQGTMSRQLITQQLAYLDQQRNNNFQQLATNAARTEAGQKPIEVSPAQFDTTLKQNVVDIGTLNGQVAATDYVLNLVNTTATDGLKTASSWFLSTKVGGALKGAYVDAKAKVASFFAKEETDAKVAEGKQLVTEARSK
jgi:hypothetical protein